MIPTAEEFSRQQGTDMDYFTIWNEELMINFAKLCVEEALKSAAENAQMDFKYEYTDFDKPITIHIINKDSILNAYPLENIQ